MSKASILLLPALGAVAAAAFAVDWKDSQSHLALVQAGMLPAQVEEVMGKARGPVYCDGSLGFARMEWGYRAGLVRFVNDRVTEVAFRPEQNPSFPSWNFHTP